MEVISSEYFGVIYICFTTILQVGNIVGEAIENKMFVEFVNSIIERRVKSSLIEA